MTLTPIRITLAILSPFAVALAFPVAFGIVQAAGGNAPFVTALAVLIFGGAACWVMAQFLRPEPDDPFQEPENWGDVPRIERKTPWH